MTKRGAKVDELALTPLELIRRIAALVPPPRIHRHRYFGVLAPNSPLRSAVTAQAAPAQATAQTGTFEGASGVAAYRYDPNGHELYDEMTRRLFSRLHGYGAHRVVFAQRGHKPRTKAFMEAIEQEDKAFEESLGLTRPKPSEVVCGLPKDHAGLQAVDYYLWALQRFYERGEMRYLDFIWPQTLEIIDLDAPQPKKRGRGQEDYVIFNKGHPLTLESRAGVGNRDREI